MQRPQLRPDRRYLILTSVLVAVALAVGVGVGLTVRGRAPGNERGPCYGNGTCDTGLSCISQICVASPAAPAPAPRSTATSAAGAAAAAAVLAFRSGPDKTYQNLEFTFDVIENNLCACDEIHCLGERIKSFESWVSAADRPALARMLRESVRLATCTRRLYTSNRIIEASLQLSKLGLNAKRAFAQMSQYPKGKAALTPAQPCCQQPDHHCQWTASTWQDPVWKSIDFEVHEAFMFQYSYESDGNSFTATAVGDPDCSGKTMRFTMTGKNENFHPTVKLEGPISQ